MDLTGGVTECIGFEKLHDAPAMKQVEFYEKLVQAIDEGTIILFCTDALMTAVEKGVSPFDFQMYAV